MTRSRHDPDDSLPCDVTSFIGRGVELRALQLALEQSRLVTLTGVGGVGKTRLALAAARRHRRAFRDGVWFVGLDAVTDPNLVSHVAAAAVGLSVPSTSSPEQILLAHLRDRRTLLLVDNCEHLLQPAGRLISVLLRACPGLSVLATSRSALGLAGETVWPVRPLAAPAGEPDPGASNAEAVELLIARAASKIPGFTLGPDEAPLAALLCRRLDGLPLAIELAATRLRAISLVELLDALDDRFDVLGTGPADAPSRQRSLRDTVEWSYELCGPAEQELWTQLAFLPSSFTLATAAALAGTRRPTGVLASLEALIGMSIVVAEHRDGGVRFRMLETLRAFGRERAGAAGSAAEVRRRLSAHYSRLALQAGDSGPDAEVAATLLRQRDERPNLWAALEIALDTPVPGIDVLDVCASLWFLWMSGDTGEGRYWLERALSSSLEPSAARARALWTAGYVMLTAGDLEVCRRLLEQCITLSRELGQDALIAHSVQLLGVSWMFESELETAITLLRRATEQDAQSPERHPASIISTGQLGVALVLGGRAGEGCALASRCLDDAERSGDLWCRSWASWLHGIAAWFAGDRDCALRSTRAALEAKSQLGDRVGVAASLEQLAWIAHQDGDDERSVRLTGASLRRWRLSGGNRLFGFSALLGCADQCDVSIRQEMADEVYDRLIREGSQLSDRQAVDLGMARESPAKDPAGEVPDPLTPRERQVAALVAKGLSNRDIASRLVISERTAESHLEHIRLKLGFTSRGQIAAWMAEAAPAEG